MTDIKLKTKGNDILISGRQTTKNLEFEHVFQFKEPLPTIKVHDNGDLTRTYLIETLSSNPDLTGQFFHSSIRILTNGAVMIDGIISKDSTEFPTWKDKEYEAIRLQPFFLSEYEHENEKLFGKGLFERGLHFSGTVTPKGVRVICICDNCKRSFSLQHFHSGFSEGQYFYSSDSRQTLFVSHGQIENLPVQLQEDVDSRLLETVEAQLPEPKTGHYKYYNPFRCPHCQYAFIDFQTFKYMRPKEYYGNYFLNSDLQRIDGK